MLNNQVGEILSLLEAVKKDHAGKGDPGNLRFVRLATSYVIASIGVLFFSTVGEVLLWVSKCGYIVHVEISNESLVKFVRSVQFLYF